MDLANHHLARAMQEYDAGRAERINEYRRIAEERRTEQPRFVPAREPAWIRAWHRLSDAVTMHGHPGHRHAH